jgi:outer membrane protein OmpA-like peptidoglycan-associated protein
MTKTTSYLLLMLITILAGTYFYMTCCSSCGIPVKEEPTKEAEIAPVATEVPEATSYPFAFSEGDYAYNENDNYNFNTSSSSFLTPISQKVTDGITSLKGYLAENAGKVINVTGYYKSDETNDTALPNLGLARANAVKNHMLENGIASNQINTMGKLMDGMIAQDGTYLGPIEYGLDDEAENAGDELQALYDRITADPLVLYFETNQSAINLSAEQRQKVADISRYLDKVPGATCSVTGHTDNVGPSAPNTRLGQGRADFAKSYLSQNGISASRINATSKGESQPVDSNTTEAGRSKNRRTVVTLNK